MGVRSRVGREGAEMSVNNQMLDSFIELRESFLKLYSVSGLISVESLSGVHLTETAFRETFDSYDVLGMGSRFKLITNYNGVDFFAITDLDYREVVE